MADEQIPEHEKTHAGVPDAVPGDDKAHAHSHAAHLETEGKGHMSNVAVGKQGREPGSVDYPPQDPRLTGRTRSGH